MTKCDYCKNTPRETNVAMAVDIRYITTCNLTPPENMSVVKRGIGDICNECLKNLDKIVAEILEKMKNDGVVSATTKG